ncbi:MAG: DNA-directed RNA polymerase specialized sigma24 family protein [Planctomycetota bacterium]|jgi:DNA-directed RNA polymerase specialized sigma24 family protein
MPESNVTLSLHDLMQQAGRFHALASRFVGDGHIAEDMVPDAWVASLEASRSRRATPSHALT